MSRNIDNTEDILDARDVIKRHEELESERYDLTLTIEAAEEEIKEEAEDCGEQEKEEHAKELEKDCEALKDWDEENGAEFKALAEFIDEGSDEWRHGETLIRETYFQTYAQELAEETCDMKSANCWPFNCIDWEKAAQELQYDYSGADFDGVTYYYRS